MSNILKLMSRASAAALAATVTVAQAQVSPAIQINFNGTAPVPLSPALTVLIAIAVGGVAVLALRRWRRTGTIAGLLAATAFAAFAPGNARFVQDAHAGAATIPLAVSPTIYTISAQGTYVFQNVVATPISLTLVRLNNPNTLTINPVGTTCAPGVVLAPNATCAVVVVDNS